MNNRQGNNFTVFLHHGNGKFLAADKFFHQNIAGIFKSICKRFIKLIFFFNNFHADTGTLACRFNNYRQAETLHNFFFYAAFFFINNQAGRSGNACVAQHAFGNNLVHAGYAGNHAAAGIGHFAYFQQSLQTAVFAVKAVHSVKNNFCFAFGKLFAEIARVKVNFNNIGITIFPQRIGNGCAGI